MEIKTYYSLEDYKASFKEDYKKYTDTFWGCSEKQFIEENIEHYEYCLKNVSYIVINDCEKIK